MGKCKYCGQPAGLFSHAHKECVEKYRNLKNSEIAESSNGISISFDWLPKDRISLSEALKLFVKNLGIQILLDNKLPKYLSDSVDFSECKASEFVLREFIHNKMLRLIVDENDESKRFIHFQKLSEQAETEFGFNPTIVEYVVEALKQSIDKRIDNDIKKCKASVCTSIIVNTTSNSSVSHLLFWGIPLGNPIDRFDDLLKVKGYKLSDCKKPGDKTYGYAAYGFTEEFIGYGSYVTLYESPYSAVIYKAKVDLYKMTEDSYSIYNKLYPLLLQKYGTPFRDDDIKNHGLQADSGVFFNIPEGKISLTFGEYHTFDYSLTLTYEDSVSMRAIAQEISLYEKELKRKQELEDCDYKNRLIKDL